MDLKQFNALNENKKVIFLLGLSEKVIPIFSQNEDKVISRNSINICWEWLVNKHSIGEELYDILDDEEKGITIIQEMSGNDRDMEAWNCIIDAVAYTCRKAFENENVKYFPEPIELVDDNLVIHFLNCFKKCVLEAANEIERVEKLLRSDDIISVNDFKYINKEV
ncbi:Imm6 family immunity protein [Bacillus cereus group sp. BfR-BA-01380]|uniref:Imm6 family immunity protein n=1 Tax=Bacillus cereus group sp. BfR-BA-01380 TaxID=2920324 RepID=UPI001F5789A1|nr:Imm6 family immunity protein [Bacillus cereus group sp. BfR-BA-01380]